MENFYQSTVPLKNYKFEGRSLPTLSQSPAQAQFIKK